MGPGRSLGDYEGFHSPVCPHAQGHTAIHSKYKILAAFLHSQDTGPSFLLCLWPSSATGGSDSNSALEIASLIKLVLGVMEFDGSQFHCHGEDYNLGSLHGRLEV